VLQTAAVARSRRPRWSWEFGELVEDRDDLAQLSPLVGGELGEVTDQPRVA
jgi:hypothetical protein